jgi:MIP family channel proteins
MSLKITISETIPHRDRSFSKTALFLEMLGTWGLTYIGGMACMNAAHPESQSGMDLVGVATTHGIVLAIMVYCAGSISGSHFNPAVSLSMLISGHIGAIKMLWYWAAQLCGSLLGGLMIKIYHYTYTVGIGHFLEESSYPHLENPRNFNLFGYFMFEMIATYFLVLVIYSTAVNTTKPKTELYGIAIGGTLGFNILAIGSFTGGALNPFRVLGPAICSGEWLGHNYDYMWIYIVGPCVGASLCGLCWRFMYAFEDENRGRVFARDRMPETLA